MKGQEKKLLEKFGDRSIKIGSPQNNEAIETEKESH